MSPFSWFFFFSSFFSYRTPRDAWLHLFSSTILTNFTFSTLRKDVLFLEGITGMFN
jgi:hypothetical protein